MNPLRDSLAHSLEAEAYRRPTYEWYRPGFGGWREAFEIVAGLMIFGSLFLGIPFLLFIAGVPA